MGYRSVISGELAIEGLTDDQIATINANVSGYYADYPLCQITTADNGTVVLASEYSDWVKAYGFTKEVEHFIAAVTAAGGRFTAGELIREGEDDTDKERYIVQIDPVTNISEVIHEELVCVWEVCGIPTNTSANDTGNDSTDTDPRIGTRRPY